MTIAFCDRLNVTRQKLTDDNKKTADDTKKNPAYDTKKAADDTSKMRTKWRAAHDQCRL